MPKIGELLSNNAILYKLKAEDKKSVIHSLAQVANTAYGIDANLVFEHAMAREALGGTGIGEGVAIPHARLKGLSKVCGLFALLDKPVDFEAYDSMPADIVFMLLSPEDCGAEHLKSLAKLARLFKSSDFRASVRTSRNLDSLYAVITNAELIQV